MRNKKYLILLFIIVVFSLFLVFILVNRANKTDRYFEALSKESENFNTTQ